MDTLEPHDFVLQPVIYRDAANQAQPRMRMTYYLGQQGPFVHEYAKEEWSAARVKQDVEQQRQYLRELGA